MGGDNLIFWSEGLATVVGAGHNSIVSLQSRQSGRQRKPSRLEAIRSHADTYRTSATLQVIHSTLLCNYSI